MAKNVKMWEQTNSGYDELKLKLSPEMITDTGVYVTGYYQGNTAWAAAGSKTITLGFTPKAVLVINTRGGVTFNASNQTVYGGLILSNQPLYSYLNQGRTKVAWIVTNGFTVTSTAKDGESKVYASMCETGKTYNYIAFRYL